MHPHSNLSQAQREQAVELFEHGYGASAGLIVSESSGARFEGLRVDSVYMADFVL